MERDYLSCEKEKYDIQFSVGGGGDQKGDCYPYNYFGACAPEELEKIGKEGGNGSKRKENQL